MINPFLLSADERLEHWKAFRKSLADKTETDQLQAVAQYWAHAPLLNIAYDCEDPETWPSIWEMIQLGDWCRNSIAIGMEGTLRLLGFAPERITLGMLIDHDISLMVMAVRIDADKLLNYDYGIVSPCSTTNHRWIRRYRWSGRKYLDF